MKTNKIKTTLLLLLIIFSAALFKIYTSGNIPEITTEPPKPRTVTSNNKDMPEIVQPESEQTGVNKSKTPQTTPDSELKASSETIVLTNDPNSVVEFAKSRGIGNSGIIKVGEGSAVLLNTAANNPILQQLPNGTVSTNYTYRPALTPTETSYSSHWNLDRIQMPAAWDISTGSSDVTLAIIDSGILSSQTINGTTYSVADLPFSRMKLNAGEQGTTTSSDTCWDGAAKDKTSNACDDDANGYVDDWRGWDFMGGFRGNSATCPNHSDDTTYANIGEPNFIEQDNDPQPYSCDSPSNQNILNKEDYNGDCNVSACDLSHGTMVASVAAADMNDGGVVGVNPNVQLMNLRIFDGYGYTDSARIAAAITYAKDNGAQIINMSLGFTTCNGTFIDATIESAMIAAKAAGVTIVVASGNQSTSSVCYPASSTSALSVGATSASDTRASFSSYGSRLDISAPGVSVPADLAPSLAYGSATSGLVSGTSFAAPTVAGVAAIIKGMLPSATPDEIEDLLMLRSDILSGMNSKPQTNDCGYGRLNAYTSLRVISGQLPVYRLSTSALPDSLYTNNILERNTYLTDAKWRYQGISFWDTGSNYDGNLNTYRDDTAH